MIYTPQIASAIRFSVHVHEVYRKQRRKILGTPYIIHPLTVGLILAQAHVDEDVVIAGILHDTIEDSIEDKKVTRDLLATKYGERVASIVESVTEHDKSLPWEERKQIAVEGIAHLSIDAALVKAANSICNITDLIKDYKRMGDDMFNNFNASKEQIIEQHLQVIKSITTYFPESPFVTDLNHKVSELNALMQAKNNLTR